MISAGTVFRRQNMKSKYLKIFMEMFNNNNIFFDLPLQVILIHYKRLVMDEDDNVKFRLERVNDGTAW